MFRKAMALWVVLASITSFAVATEMSQAPPALSATEIVARNVVARGGLERWRSVQALAMSGQMEAGGNRRTTLSMPVGKESHFMPPPRPAEQVRLPFVMELKRPRKLRVELQFNGETAVQVFDGTRGWKLRPFLNRREVEPYSEEEMKSVVTQAELDGPLVDYVAKGTKVDFAGTEKVDQRDTYKLKLTTKDGKSMAVWVDAGSFLEVKIQGTPRLVDGKYHPVEVYFGDYRSVDGLQIPFALETRVVDPPAIAGAVPRITSSEKILLDKVQVNPVLNDASFSREDLDAVAMGKQTAAMGHLKLAQ